MKLEIERINLIDKFLRGELAGASLDAFKNKLRTDEVFADEVNSQRAIIEGIKLARREQLLFLLNGGKLPNIEITPKPLIETPTELDEVQNDNTTELNESVNNESNDDDTHTMNSSIDPNFSNFETFKTKSKSNFNNWYFAVAAILLTVFVYYYIFGYYIPHQRILDENKDSISALENEIKATEQKIDTLAQVPQLQTNSNDSNLSDSSIQRINPLNNTDSLKSESDQKITESQQSITSYELINSEGQNNTPGSTNQNSANVVNSKILKKTNNTLIKVENWHSTSNFKGYKYKNTTLQIFDMPADETITLKYLDKALFLKKNGNYYKLNATGHFEQFQKETKSELIKFLDSI